ncbi:hypothetical protein ACS0TY_014496 [Phlomoides rotata]
MIVLSWNCRGLGNLGTVRTLKKSLHEKDPSIVFLMETKFTYTQMINVNSHSLHFDGYIPVDCSFANKGRSGGLCMLWKGNLHALLVTFSHNHIYINVNELGRSETWRLSGIYGWPARHQRSQTFQLLRRIAPGTNHPWLCVGDMNEIMWT